MKITLKNAFLIFSLTFFSLSSYAAEKEWTFLLFLNGHNNLSRFGEMNIKDMEKTGSTDQVNLVVEWGSDSEFTHRLLVEKSTDPSKVTSPILMSMNHHDMGDYKNFIEFVKWGIEKYPAKRYFVAVWNHGTGWHRDISYDDHSGNKITTEQLGLAMTEIKNFLGRPVDIYGSDACLMSMVEVATEMKGAAHYFVGSEEVEPGEGWPYEPLMKAWASQPNILPADLSVLLSKEYVKAYSEGGVYTAREVTFSVMDLTQLDSFIQSAKAFSNHLRTLGPEALKIIKASLELVQSFTYSDYKDYGDLLATLQGLPFVKDDQVFQNAQNDLKKLVITVDSSPVFVKATGISIWIPNYESEDMLRYTGLEFDKQTSWSEFLKSILAIQ